MKPTPTLRILSLLVLLLPFMVAGFGLLWAFGYLPNSEAGPPKTPIERGMEGIAIAIIVHGILTRASAPKP